MNIAIDCATGGIGSAVSEIFANEGHNLILIGRDENKLNELKNKLIKNNNSCINCFSSSGYSDALIKVNEFIDKKNIGIDVLINTCGVFNIEDFSMTGERDYDECFDVNVKRPIFVTLGLFDALKRCKGKVINIGSTSSYNGFKNTVLYCSSKHALLGFSRSLHEEWKDEGISVHCISPGTVDTQMANILDQDKSTYIQTHEIAKLVFDICQYTGNMVIPEIKAIRKIVR